MNTKKLNIKITDNFRLEFLQSQLNKYKNLEEIEFHGNPFKYKKIREVIKLIKTTENIYTKTKKKSIFGTNKNLIDIKFHVTEHFFCLENEEHLSFWKRLAMMLDCTDTVIFRYDHYQEEYNKPINFTFNMKFLNELVDIFTIYSNCETQGLTHLYKYNYRFKDNIERFALSLFKTHEFQVGKDTTLNVPVLPKEQRYLDAINRVPKEIDCTKDPQAKERYFIGKTEYPCKIMWEQQSFGTNICGYCSKELRENKDVN